MVVRPSWLSGRALVAQARGVLGLTHSDCRSGLGQRRGEERNISKQVSSYGRISSEESRNLLSVKPQYSFIGLAFDSILNSSLVLL